MANMKRFFLFGGNSVWEKCGGWSDFKGSFSSVNEAVSFVAKSGDKWAWFQIIDSRTGENVDNF
jgi:hypothetical protein